MAGMACACQGRAGGVVCGGGGLLKRRDSRENILQGAGKKMWFLR